MSDDVLDRANELGRLLANDPRTRALRDATAAVQADAASKRLEEDYARAIEEVRSLEEAGRPIEPDAKRRLALLAEQVRFSPTLQRLLRAHHEFLEMMDGVQHAIGGAVDAALAPAGEAAKRPAADEGPSRLIVP
jgi:cell fate (sporulation/competence/biofilm development) regulator YlbF (YheA/YmcA/DUF963 family)